jgi:hypothetical protein
LSLATATCGAALLAACVPSTPSDNEPAVAAADAADPASLSYRPPPDSSTEIHEVPETGVSLGWGWNAVSAEPVPTICVEFVEGNEPAQTRFMAMHEVSDSFELMQRMGMSAEASVKTIGFKASGKASFAKDLNVSSYASNFVMNASVENGVRYAAPVPLDWRVASTDPLLVGPRGGRTGEIRLTAEALRLAQAKDPAEFIHRCGHGFVSAVYSGAKLTAVITVNTSSRAEHDAVSAEMSGSGWGARFKAALSQSTGTKTEKKDLNVSIFQTGGRGDSIPVTKEDVLAKLEMLSSIAFDAPKDFHMAVASYETLANWPARNIEVESDEYEQVASLWGAYDSLYDDIQDVLDRPDEFVGPVVRDDGCVAMVAAGADGKGGLGPAQTARLRRVQDDVLDALRRLRNFAQSCATTETGCKFPEHQFRSPYAYRIQMPIEKPATDSKAGAASGSPATGAGPSVEDVLALHVAGPAKRRCEDDPDGIGCLTNAEIDRWREKLGMELVKFESLAARDAVVERLSALGLFGQPGSCGGANAPAGPAYSIEPGFPALWYHPRVAACVKEPATPAAACGSTATGG